MKLENIFLFQIFLYNQICITIVVYLIKQKNLQKNHFKSLTHIQYEERIRMNHTVKSPDFFDINEIFSDKITKRNEKFDLLLIKSDFGLVFQIDS